MGLAVVKEKNRIQQTLPQYSLISRLLRRLRNQLPGVPSMHVGLYIRVPIIPVPKWNSVQPGCVRLRLVDERQLRQLAAASSD